MTSIWLPQSARVTDYAASVKGPKAVVTVKIEVGEPGDLGYLLRAERALGRVARSSAPLLITDQREG